MSLNDMAFVKSNSAPATSPPYKAVKEKMTEIIKQELEKTNAVGLSIALVDDQQIVWAQGFGYQDKENQIPATENTIYQVASITKLFTVLAAMQLAEQEKLDIDQPLQKYLRDFSMKSRFASNQPITARTIMTHHSGILSDHLKGCMSKPYSSLVKDLQDEYVAFPPNYIFSYSNAAFTLLGHTVATVSKKEYSDYIQDELLCPIGMQHSFIANFPSADNPLMSKNYSKGQEDKAYPLRDIPAGAPMQMIWPSLCK
jgi:CubicO group peptidase (beta-lactamase class C family)